MRRDDRKPQESCSTCLTATIFLMMVVYAVSITMIGPLMPAIISFYGLRLSQGGLLMTALSTGGILAIVLGGLIADRTSKPWLLALAFGLYVVTLFVAGGGVSFSLLLLVFFFMGAGTRLGDTIKNAYISDLHSRRREVYLNLLHTFFGVGAILGPSLVSITLNRGQSWQMSFTVLGVIALLALLVFMTVLRRNPALATATAGDEAGTGNQEQITILLKQGRLWLLALIMIMYLGHQSGLVVWLPMYIEEHLGSTPFLGGLSLTVMWAGIIAGRLLSARVSRHIPPRTSLFWGASGGTLILLGTFLLGDVQLVIVTAGLVGFLTGATIPLILNIGCGWYPANSGTVSAMIFLTGSVSTMFFPWFIGMLAEGAGFRAGILVTALSLGGVSALSLLIPRRPTNNAPGRAGGGAGIASSGRSPQDRR